MIQEIRLLLRVLYATLSRHTTATIETALLAPFLALAWMYFSPQNIRNIMLDEHRSLDNNFHEVVNHITSSAASVVLTST